MSGNPISSGSFDKFENSAYYLASQKYQTLNALNEGDIKFSYGSVSMKADRHSVNPNWSFSRHYSSANWRARKILAIPKCYAAILKTIAQVVMLALEAVRHVLILDAIPLKRRSFQLVRQCQCAIGHLVTLFHDKVGSYLVQSSQFHLTSYALHGSKNNESKSQEDTPFRYPDIFPNDVKYLKAKKQRKIYYDLQHEIPWQKEEGQKRVEKDILDVSSQLTDEAFKGLNFNRLCAQSIEALVRFNTDQLKEIAHRRLKLLTREKQWDIFRRICQVGFSYTPSDYKKTHTYPLLEWIGLTVKDFDKMWLGQVTGEDRNKVLKSMFEIKAIQTEETAVEYFKKMSAYNQSWVFSETENPIFFSYLKPEALAKLNFRCLTLNFLEKLFPRGTAEEKASSKAKFEQLSEEHKLQFVMRCFGYNENVWLNTGELLFEVEWIPDSVFVKLPFVRLSSKEIKHLFPKEGESRDRESNRRLKLLRPTEYGKVVVARKE